MENIPSEKLIYSKNAVTELLLSDEDVDVVYIASKDGNSKIIALAKKRKILIKGVSKEKLDSMVEGKNQGVVAVVSPFKYSEIDEILAVASERGQAPFLIIADGIEDPHNLGAIIRTAEASGAHGVIIPKRRSASLNSTVYKTSAGAVSWLKVGRVTNITETIKTLKTKGIWIFGAEANGETLYNCDLSGAIAIVIGGEGKGLSELVRKNCDKIVSIPMSGHVNSLNASVSAGILMYEVVKTRL